MYKINSVTNLNYLAIRGVFITKKLSKKIKTQSMVFLRAPKHFNIGKHKILSFNTKKSYVLKTKLKMHSICIIKHNKFFFNLLNNIIKVHPLYNVKSLVINTKINILW